MKKSVIVNLNEVGRAVGRPAEHLLKFLGQNLNANSVAENNGSKANAYVAGHQDTQDIQDSILTFIQRYVMCKHCSNPETTCGREGNDKKPMVFLKCKSCGKRSILDSTDR